MLLSYGCGLVQVETRLGELQNTLDAGLHHRDNVFKNIGYNLDQWTVMVSHVFW